MKNSLQTNLGLVWVSKFCSMKSEKSKLQFLNLVMEMANELAKK